GTNAAGTAALALPNGTGLLILGSHNTVGGPAYAGNANVISGNGVTGVEIRGSAATGNLIQFNFIGTAGNGTAALGNGVDDVLLGNRIGTDVNGTAPLGNSGDGVLIEGGASGNSVGPANVISGNRQNGVEISGASANLVTGNRIGTDAGGSANLGNAGDGVRL